MSQCMPEEIEPSELIIKQEVSDDFSSLQAYEDVLAQVPSALIIKQEVPDEFPNLQSNEVSTQVPSALIIKQEVPVEFPSLQSNEVSTQEPLLYPVKEEPELILESDGDDYFNSTDTCMQSAHVYPEEGEVQLPEAVQVMEPESDAQRQVLALIPQVPSTTRHSALIPLSLCQVTHASRGNSPSHLQGNKSNNICTRCGKTLKCLRSPGGDIAMIGRCSACGEPFGDFHFSNSNYIPNEMPTVTECPIDSASPSGHLKGVTCEICVKSFSDLPELRDHRCLKKNNKKLKKCDQCEKTFTGVSELRVHRLEHFGPPQHMCKSCGKSFSWPCRLKVHRCKGIKLQVEVKSKPQKLKECRSQESKCKERRQVFCNHASWKDPRPTELFRCGECDEAFIMFKGLEDHKCKGAYRSICPICHRDFASKSSLKTHIYIHTQERPYACDICGKSFNRSNLLKVHRRTHTGETPHVCEKCKKSFDWPCRMKNHRCINRLDNKHYYCNNCNKITNDKRHRCPKAVRQMKQVAATSSSV